MNTMNETNMTEQNEYYILRYGDRVKEGDEFFLDLAWEPANSIGANYGMDDGAADRCVYRRKLTDSKNPNYRMLVKGEVIQEGDEYWLYGEWASDDASVGETYDPTGPHYFLPRRRPIKSIKKEVQQYRMLQEGELFRDGDEFEVFKDNGVWIPRSLYLFGKSYDPKLYYNPTRRPIKGYRDLKVGEKIQLGDEYFQTASGDWVQTSLDFIGSTLGKGWSHHRRPIDANPNENISGQTASDLVDLLLKSDLTSDNSFKNQFKDLNFSDKVLIDVIFDLRDKVVKNDSILKKLKALVE
jgi:hypothetical protein